MLGGDMIEHLTDRVALANTTSDPAGTAFGWLAGITGIVVIAVALALAVLLVAAVISALVNDNTTAGGKLLWILFILWFPLFGAIAWFVVGKKGYLNRILGIDKGKVRHTSPPSVGQHSDIRDSGPIPRPGGEHDFGDGHYSTGSQQASGRF
ncbi:PLD nuclease N-terminal domain-containing protein [Nocardiopsis flavescens]|uniref:PLD nuclease N-terminal domain-containing protein n=1 Tax=Nocardiopsis flavescens TaxID=758803 RepID=UPI00365B1485